MKQAGAEIVSRVDIPGYEELGDDRPSCRAFKFNLNEYLENLGPDTPFKNLTEIIEAGKFHSSIRPTLERNEEEEIPPRLIGDLNTPHGNNSNRLAPPTGFPAITVPMGFVDGLPSGLQILGDAFSEPTLIGIAYSYEQTTHHRHPPEALP